MVVKKCIKCIALVAALALSIGPATAQSIDSSAGSVRVEVILDGLDEPWGLGFLPDGAFLVTERGGRLVHSKDGQTQSVSGVPDIYEDGQGGLLDVMVPRDFATSRDIFLSYAQKMSGGSGTALAVGTLSQDGTRLDNLRRIFEMKTDGSGGRHFGGRIIEGRDGTVFLTLGERGDRDAAQDLSRHNGSIVRVNRDGSIPAGNPFIDKDGALPEIWSYGHRNPQGAALDLDGQLWVSEHGARGGDEINRIDPGRNYGWPVISYGRHYSGFKIGEGTKKPGMEQPLHYWDPSIAPSGLLVYSGKLWPDWRGDFFVGSLKFDYLSRLDPDAGWQEEKLSSPRTERVRDVKEAPDGSIWILSVGKGAVLRLSPG
ncbi:MAG: PQQ-dependent sugar dehydrogenase [Marinosulfonomonas sp.]